MLSAVPADVPADVTPPAMFLVIEDSPMYRELLTHWIEHLGFAVLACATLREGVVHLATHPEIAGVVLDLRLPDTLDTEAITRGTQAAPLVPVAVLTGSERPGIASTVIDLGAKLFLHKNTATQETLEALITALLASR